MTTYLLDTNIISYLEDPLSPFHAGILQRIRSLEQDDVVCISILSVYEYEYAIHTADRETAEGLVRTRETALDLFPVVPLSLEGAAHPGFRLEMWKSKGGGPC
ncbi:MAG: PIN domain-containing protein [Magnetococcales bacterium]|nr:PIN domain-containing protein [Magnetococcales bacterium]